MYKPSDENNQIHKIQVHSAVQIVFRFQIGQPQCLAY